MIIQYPMQIDLLNGDKELIFEKRIRYIIEMGKSLPIN